MTLKAVTQSTPKVLIKKVMLDDENKEDVSELIRMTLATLKRKELNDVSLTEVEDKDKDKDDVEYIY